VLRLLALWVSDAFRAGYQGAYRDPLIGLGSAPLEDANFRAALFEQLGSSDLEGPVTTDIAGREAHAARLDHEAKEAVRKARLHQKVATVILFESNGGQTKAEATLPEVRLAVGEPDLDIANVEPALDALAESCYFLSTDRNRYRFSLRPNLNKLLSDRRAGVRPEGIEERVKQEVQLVREYGPSGRTFKSALIFAVPDSASALEHEARNVLAWEDIADDAEMVKRLDEGQQRQLETSSRKAARDAFYSSPALPRLLDPQAIKRTIVDGVTQGVLAYVGKAEDGRFEPFHFQTSLSEADVEISEEMFILRAEDARKYVEPPRLERVEVRPAALHVRPGEPAAFTVNCYDQHERVYPCPEIRWHASDGRIDERGHFVAEAVGAYTVKAEVRAQGPGAQGGAPQPLQATAEVEVAREPEVGQAVLPLSPAAEKGLGWRGAVPAQKWMNFYTKVLSRFALTPGLRLEVRFTVPPGDAVTAAKIEETRAALRELGLDEQVDLE
jgi:hypothetical protein